jgi:membrane fusion protein (multidrug efflux system)
MKVRKGQLLARLDEEELRAQVAISRVNVSETEQAFERAKTLFGEALVSSETFDQARSAYESAVAQLQANEIQLGYTEIQAPFDGRIITRYVDFAEQVSANTPLFRLSDFDPLLCPIQVPERELPGLSLGQRAYLTVEPWPGEKFDAKVLRLSPVVDAETGTVKVTLEVDAREKLRPGMFARVFLETASRSDTLVVRRSALSLDSIGDTVYVAEDGLASRREVELGFREGDLIEVLSGLAEGEPVVVVGQDGLSDGTPVQVLDRGGDVRTASAAPAAGPGVGGSGPPVAAAPGGPPRGGRRMDFSTMSPEQLEQIKERMRARGMTDEQIEARLQGGGPGGGGPGDPAAGGFGGGPGRGGPRLDISKMTPEEIDQLKERMRSRGLTEEQIEERLQRMRERAAQDADR